MTVRFVGEPNYQLIEEAMRKLLMSMTPEQRRKYAYEVGEDARKDDGTHWRRERPAESNLGASPQVSGGV